MLSQLLFGLPALLAWMKAMGRQRPLRILHGPGADSWIRTILDVGYPGSFDPSVCFPIELCALAPKTPTHWDDITLRIAQSTHKVPNWSLRVEGHRLSIAYSGDGSPSQETVNLFQGVTHLVHECSWARKLKDGHGDVESLLAVVPAWHVEHLYLVHALVSHRAQILSEVATFEGSTCVTVPEAGEVISLDL